MTVSLVLCCSTVSDDSITGLDWTLFGIQGVSAVATVFAAWYAARAIVIARRQASETAERLRRERRIDFQLDVLRDLANHNLRGENVGWTGPEYRVLAALLPPDLVPLSRAVIGLASTPEAVATVQAREAQGISGSLREAFRPEIEEEIIVAIERLIRERE